MFTVKHKLSLQITGNIFAERTSNQYNLRNRPVFITPHVHSVFKGTGSFERYGYCSRGT